MKVRLSLASMLIAPAALAALVISANAQVPAPAEKAGAPKVETPAQEPAPPSAAPAQEEATGPAKPADAAPPKARPKSRSKSVGPSPERAADLKKAVEDKKAKASRKRIYEKKKKESDERRQEAYERQKMQEMILRANQEVELARLQAAQMEGIARREAEARMIQLQTALLNATIEEDRWRRDDLLARDDPEQYRRLEAARINAYNAQQRTFQALAEALRAQAQARQGGPGGTSGVSIQGTGPAGQPQPGRGGTPSNPGRFTAPPDRPQAQPTRETPTRDHLREIKEMRNRSNDRVPRTP